MTKIDRKVQGKSFKGADTARDFCDWLFEPQPAQFKVNKNGEETCAPNYRRTVIVHNAQGYDMYFILNYMIKSGVKPDVIIRRGGKLLYMTKRGNCIRFIDSLSFLSMSLAKLTSAFEFPQFLHKWCMTCHQTHSLEYPSSISVHGLRTSHCYKLHFRELLWE